MRIPKDAALYAVQQALRDLHLKENPLHDALCEQALQRVEPYLNGTKSRSALMEAYKALGTQGKLNNHTTSFEYAQGDCLHFTTEESVKDAKTGYTSRESVPFTCTREQLLQQLEKCAMHAQLVQPLRESCTSWLKGLGITPERYPTSFQHLSGQCLLVAESYLFMLLEGKPSDMLVTHYQELQKPELAQHFTPASMELFAETFDAAYSKNDNPTLTLTDINGRKKQMPLMECADLLAQQGRCKILKMLTETMDIPLSSTQAPSPHIR